MTKKLMVLLGLLLILMPAVMVMASGSTEKGAEAVSLKMWWEQDETKKAPLDAAIEDYKAINPNVEIIAELQPGGDTYDKLKISIAGNTQPDIVKLDHVFVQALGYKGALADLVPLGANKIKDKFLPSTWAANMYKDQVYALPFDANTIAFMYNKDILEAAGAKVPTTYEEIIQTGKAINALKLPETYAYTVPVTPGVSGWLGFQFYFWLWRNGAEILNDDWTKAVYNSPEGIGALQKILDLVGIHGIVPANVYLENEFYGGKVGMLDMGCWHVPTITKDDAVANFGISVMPTLKAGVPGHSGLGLYSIGVTAASKNTQAAFDFISHFSSGEKYQLMYSKSTNLMPSLTGAYDDPFYDTPEWSAFLAQLEVAKSRPGSPAWPQINEHVEVAVQEALTGLKTAEQAMNDAAAKSNAVLAELK
jgi:multiple sugar transport system substrate-binding protein